MCAAPAFAPRPCRRCGGPVPAQDGFPFRYCPPCREARQTKTCPTCGERFWVTVDKVKRQRFCSNRCRALAPQEVARLAAMNAPRLLSPADCEHCGAPLGGRREARTRFCSKACWRQSDACHAWVAGLRGAHGQFVARDHPPDPPAPTPAELFLRTAEVRSEWDDAERLARLRWDWRPRVRLCC